MTSAVSAPPSGRAGDAVDARAPLTSGARVEWVNYAKGIGIVLVVVGHVWRGVAAQATPGEGRVMEVIDTAIYHFHMPLFFFLSGLFVARSARRPLPTFMLQKVKTILYPYVLWTLIQAAVASHAGSGAHHAARFLDVLWQLPYRPYQQFWFLYVLFLCMMAFGLLSKLRLGSLAILFVAADFYMLRTFVPGINWGPLFQFSGNFVYFAAGAALAPVAIHGVMKFAASLLVLVAATQWGTVVYLSARAPGAFLMNDVTFAAAAGIAATAAASALLAKTPGTRLLAFVGEESLVIYVAHVVFAAGVRTVLLKLHVAGLPIHLLAGTLAGLALPVLLDLGVRRAGFKYLFSL